MYFSAKSHVYVHQYHLSTKTQGDAILLKTPRGQFLLIDGGGNAFYDVGKITVLPYLHRRGIRQLSLLLNTHPDNDHLQGVESVSEEIPVKYLALPGSLSKSKEYRPLKQIAVRNSIPVLNLQAGQAIKLEEGLRIKVLHPGGQVLDKNDNNNQSVVLSVSYGNFSMLLTGDIGVEAMQALLNEGQLAATTIVKVPHHGSKGSLLPQFYKAISPRYAVISVGSNNIFGHPNPGVVDMLQQNNIKILRTDKDGAVIMRTNGEELSVSRTITAEE